MQTGPQNRELRWCQWELPTVSRPISPSSTGVTGEMGAELLCPCQKLTPRVSQTPRAASVGTGGKTRQDFSNVA